MAVQISLGPNQRMLELGGGANRHPASLVNLDVRQCPGVDIVCDFNKDPLPYPDDEWDAVLCIFALEHVSWRRVRDVLKETYRVIKPGGRAIFVVPNVGAQMVWATRNPTGWDGYAFFESISGLLFGDLDYPENSHKSFYSPEVAKELFESTGFVGIEIQPYGERDTDMGVIAAKPMPVVQVPDTSFLKAFSPLAVRGAPVALDMPATEKFDKNYFNGGQKVGGYTREGYRDFPAHELTVRYVIGKKPGSVLELGAARGYILKRLQDAFVFAEGVEVSRHCHLTRVCDGIVQQDICETPWPVAQHDLCFSIATLEHIPEDKLPAVLVEMKRTCKRGLHGIDFGNNDDGTDKTHCTLRSRDWWVETFKKAGLESHEIVDKEMLERPPLNPDGSSAGYPPEMAQGDGKVKLNIGSFTTMFHYGWQNLDLRPDLGGFAQANGYAYRHCDVRNGLPYPTAGVNLIYSAHMLEHLTYAEGLSFLRECRRVIQPGGAMRILVPDAALLQGWYAGKVALPLDYFDEVNDECAANKNLAHKVWSLLHSGHAAAYDMDTLADLLRDAGWEPKPSRFREPADNDALRQIRCETLDVLPCLTLYMNAIGAR